MKYRLVSDGLGHMFAIDRFRVVPDILLLAKALGGGMPLGAFISSREIMSSLVYKSFPWSYNHFWRTSCLLCSRTGFSECDH